jgi:hypothetical protein
MTGLWALGVLALAPGMAGPPADPLTKPLALLDRARAAYAKVEDYSCTLIKRETVAGTPLPQEVIALKVRKAPFSVAMRWRKPPALAGQEAIYVAGQNGGKMRVKAAGWRGLIGFVSLAVDDRRVKRTSSHRITEAGIGNLIERLAAGWKEERKLGKTRVHISSTRFAQRSCTRVELTHPASARGKLLYSRSVVYFDRKTNLPIGVENYDWPGQPGEEAPLLEAFRYEDLQLNVDLPDEVFKH